MLGRARSVDWPERASAQQKPPSNVTGVQLKLLTMMDTAEVELSTDGVNAMDEHCIFCNVKDDALLHRDEDGLVIVDDPVRPGHVLVGARVHAASLHELPEDDAAALLRLAGRVAKAVVAATGAAKVYVVAIGDRDKHFHFHLLPKFENDPPLGPHVFGAGGWISFIPTNPDPHELELTHGEVLRRLAQ